MRFFILPIFLCATNIILFAQEDWGEVNPKQFLQRSCPFDTSANALVLLSEEVIHFEAGNGELYMVYEIHRRIQLLNKGGFGAATVIIPNSSTYVNEAVYDFRDLTRNRTALPYLFSYSNESIYDLKAQTLNPAANGTAMAIKVDRQYILEEKENDSITHKKIVFPAIKEGSIIEYEYKYRTKWTFFIKTWCFQENIPVLKSSLTIKCPDFIQYRPIFGGDLPVSQKTEDYDETFPIYFIGVPGPRNGMMGIPHGVSTTYMMDAVPAIKQEEYIATMNDQVSRLDLVLSTTGVPSIYLQSYFNTFNDMGNRLMKSNDFGLRLGENGEFKEIARKLTDSITDPAEKARSIFYYVAGKMKWNEIYSYLSFHRLAKSYEDGSGNSADINMLLVAMLRAAGLKADPVLISTRAHGKIEPGVPEPTQFNHLIVVVNIDTSSFYLDAISPFKPFDLLEINDLNLTGLRISDTGSRWVDILPGGHSVSDVAGTITLDSTGHFKAAMKLVAGDYDATALRGELNKKRAAEIIKARLQIPDEESVSEAKVVNESDAEQKLKINFTLDGKISGGSNNLIYLSTFIARFYADNPFKAAKRMNAVNFGYPFEKDIKLSIAIPPNYKASELPKSIHVKLNDGSADFIFLINADQQNIQINSSLKIRKTEFGPELYGDLRELFARVIDAYSSVIVLQKN